MNNEELILDTLERMNKRLSCIEQRLAVSSPAEPIPRKEACAIQIDLDFLREVAKMSIHRIDDLEKELSKRA